MYHSERSCCNTKLHLASWAFFSLSLSSHMGDLWSVWRRNSLPRRHEMSPHQAWSLGILCIVLHVAVVSYWSMMLVFPGHQHLLDRGLPQFNSSTWSISLKNKLSAKVSQHWVEKAVSESAVQVTLSGRHFEQHSLWWTSSSSLWSPKILSLPSWLQELLLKFCRKIALSIGAIPAWAVWCDLPKRYWKW